MAKDVVNLVLTWVEQGNRNSKKIVELELVNQQLNNILQANLDLLKSMNADIDRLVAQVKKLSEQNDCPWEAFNEKTN